MRQAYKDHGYWHGVGPDGWVEEGEVPFWYRLFTRVAFGVKWRRITIPHS